QCSTAFPASGGPSWVVEQSSCGDRSGTTRKTAFTCTRSTAHDWCELRDDCAVCMQIPAKAVIFCFGVLAFRVETLYLARRFCGLRSATSIRNLRIFFMMLLVRPGETGVVCRLEHTESNERHG